MQSQSIADFLVADLGIDIVKIRLMAIDNFPSSMRVSFHEHTLSKSVLCEIIIGKGSTSPFFFVR